MTYKEKADEVTLYYGKMKAAQKTADFLRKAVQAGVHDGDVLTSGGYDHIKSEIDNLDEIVDEAENRLYDLLGDD